MTAVITFQMSVLPLLDHLEAISRYSICYDNPVRCFYLSNINCLSVLLEKLIILKRNENIVVQRKQVMRNEATDSNNLRFSCNVLLF